MRLFVLFPAWVLTTGCSQSLFSDKDEPVRYEPEMVFPEFLGLQRAFVEQKNGFVVKSIGWEQPETSGYFYEHKGCFFRLTTDSKGTVTQVKVSLLASLDYATQKQACDFTFYEPLPTLKQAVGDPNSVLEPVMLAPGNVEEAWWVMVTIPPSRMRVDGSMAFVEKSHSFSLNDQGSWRSILQPRAFEWESNWLKKCRDQRRGRNSDSCDLEQPRWFDEQGRAPQVQSLLRTEWLSDPKNAEEKPVEIYYTLEL